MCNKIILQTFLLFVCVCVSPLLGVGAEEKPALDKLHIGWQTTWATQGQLSMVLQKKDFLEKNDIEASFHGFSYGGPLNQAAIADEVDVVFTADQPALTLLSKDPDWQIVGRLMYNSGALMVHPDSGVNNVEDLKGETVAVPFVAAVHRVLIDLEKKAGLNPGKDINNMNLGINEIISVAQSGKTKGWGNVKAMMVWDPTPFILEEKGLTKTIARGDIVAVVLMKKELVEKNKLGPRLMDSVKSAYWYYNRNRKEANGWFADVARIEYDPSILDKAASFEPNLEKDSIDDIRVTLNEEDLKILKTVEKFMFEQKLISTRVDVDKVVSEKAVG